MSHNSATLKLHRDMIDAAVGYASADMMTALALTVAYGIRYNSATGVKDIAVYLKAFNRLVILEALDDNSEMEKPQ